MVYHYYSKQIKAICNKNNIKFYDMNSYLMNKNIDNSWLFVDRVHLTDQANDICATAITEMIS